MKSILLISDDNSDRGSIKSLKYISHNLDINILEPVDHHQQAIERLRSGIPNIIICDMNVNGQYNGFDIMHKIGEEYQIKIPVIFAGETINKKIIRQKTKNLLVEGFLKKPIDIEQLQINLGLYFRKYS